MSPAALALCASGAAMTCALRLSSGELLVSERATQRGASIPATVASLFARAGLEPGQLDELRIDVGPGSYTGLRVAVTFARFLARFGDVRLSSITSFELIGVRAGRRVRVALDARRGRIHTAVVSPSLETRPAAIEHDRFLESIGAREVVVADASLHESLSPACARAGARLEPVPDYDAGDAFDPAVAPRPTELHALEPLYLMKSYAE